MKWFVAKRYGWGWTPSTWQGWAVLLVFIAVFAIFIVPLQPTDWNFWTWLVVWLIALLLVCWKTGEKPRWRWG